MARSLGSILQLFFLYCASNKPIRPYFQEMYILLQITKLTSNKIVALSFSNWSVLVTPIPFSHFHRRIAFGCFLQCRFPLPSVLQQWAHQTIGSAVKYGTIYYYSTITLGSALRRTAVCEVWYWSIPCHCAGQRVPPVIPSIQYVPAD